MIKWLKEVKRVYKLAYKVGLRKNDLFFAKEIILGVPVYHFSELVELKNCSVAFINNKDHNIWVDDYFLEMSQEGKEFIVMHEQGHKVKGHLNMSTRELKQIIRKRAKDGDYVHSIEIEADAYACEILGYEKCLKGLDELANIQLRRGYSAIEILARRNIIMEKQLEEIRLRRNDI